MDDGIGDTPVGPTATIQAGIAGSVTVRGAAMSALIHSSQSSLYPGNE
jgi:hypothetical protein